MSARGRTAQDPSGPDRPLPADASPEQIEAMLAHRYGNTGRRDRRAVAAVAVVALGLLGFGFWATYIGATPPISGRLVSYEVRNDAAAAVRFEVRTRPGASGPFTCALRAQDIRRVDVGYALVDIASTAGRIRTENYTITTRNKAVFVEVLACGEGTQRPDRAPAPQFPPGVRAPEQQAPGRAP